MPELCRHYGYRPGDVRAFSFSDFAMLWDAMIDQQQRDARAETINSAFIGWQVSGVRMPFKKYLKALGIEPRKTAKGPPIKETARKRAAAILAEAAKVRELDRRGAGK